MKISKLFRTLDNQYRAQHNNSKVYTPGTNYQASINIITRLELCGFTAKIITCVIINQFSIDIFLDKELLGRVVTSSRSACTFYIHNDKRRLSANLVQRLVDNFISKELIKAYGLATALVCLYERPSTSDHLLVRQKDWAWYENTYWYSVYNKHFKRKVGIKGIIIKLKVDGYEFLNPDIIPQLIENEQKKAQSRSVKRK
jgi:hypothetical protein